MPDDDISRISVGGSQVGMAGLGPIFGELKAAGREASEELGTLLVEMAAKQNYIPDAARPEYARALVREYRKYLGQEVPEEKPRGLSIRILGAGCFKCETLASNVKSALTKLDMAAEVEHVREPKKIGEYGVVGVPALIINGKLVSVGKALTVEQVAALLEEAVHGS